MSKAKLAIAWNSSCGGCDESIVDLEERILDILPLVEFVLWPCGMDFKYADVEKLADREITASLINGAIQNSDQQQIVTLLRKKSQFVIAFGSCASYGGIPSLANLTSMDEIFTNSFLTGITVDNPEKILPQPESVSGGYTLHLPKIFPSVKKLDEVIEVDYYLPGCPPTANMTAQILEALLKGNLPAKGSVVAPDKSLCSTCSRNATKPETIAIKTIKRIHEIQADPEICFLAQGVLCMGPGTRDGCEYPCIKGNMPCTGCLGPIGELDQGAKMISAVSSLVEGENEEEIDAALSNIPDPAGTFYRYSTAHSLLFRSGGKKI